MRLIIIFEDSDFQLRQAEVANHISRDHAINHFSLSLSQGNEIVTY